MQSRLTTVQHARTLIPHIWHAVQIAANVYASQQQQLMAHRQVCACPDSPRHRPDSCKVHHVSWVSRALPGGQAVLALLGC